MNGEHILDNIKHCSICKRPLNKGSIVSVLITNVEVDESTTGYNTSRLKLSMDAVEARAIRVICDKCLKIENYITNEEN